MKTWVRVWCGEICTASGLHLIHLTTEMHRFIYLSELN